MTSPSTTAGSRSAKYAVEVLHACPLCASSDVAHWLDGRDVLMERDDRSFPYAHCNACGVYFLSERPTEDTVAFFYEGDYGPYAMESRQPRFPRLNKRLLALSERISGAQVVSARLDAVYARQLGRAGAVFLDFGCGAGKALDRNRKLHNCRTIGMDFNPSVLADVQARGHETHQAGEQGWAELPDASVDLVRMNHVLEHLYQPKLVLDQVRRVLKPGGVAHIAVPNPRGYSALTYGQDWFGLDCPRHVMLYGPDAATALLRSVGFTAPVEVLGLPVTKDILRSRFRQEGRHAASPLQSDGVRALATALLARQQGQRDLCDQFHMLATRSA